MNYSGDIIANTIHLIHGQAIADILHIIAHNEADTHSIFHVSLADQRFIHAVANAATNSYTTSESDNFYCTKTCLNIVLSGKVDVSDLNSYYTKTEIDTNTYAKTQIDTNIYIKTQADNSIHANNIL